VDGIPVICENLVAGPPDVGVVVAGDGCLIVALEKLRFSSSASNEFFRPRESFASGRGGSSPYFFELSNAGDSGFMELCSPGPCCRKPGGVARGGGGSYSSSSPQSSPP
jgi:hypothetical protein